MNLTTDLQNDIAIVRVKEAGVSVTFRTGRSPSAASPISFARGRPGRRRLLGFFAMGSKWKLMVASPSCFVTSPPHRHLTDTNNITASIIVSQYNEVISDKAAANLQFRSPSVRFNSSSWPRETTTGPRSSVAAQLSMHTTRAPRASFAVSGEIHTRAPHREHTRGVLPVTRGVRAQTTTDGSSPRSM